MKIIHETPPTRCEICHQADCFDPVQNVCSRCQAVPVPQPLPDAGAAFKKPSRWRAYLHARQGDLIVLGIIFVLVGAIAIPNLLAPRRISSSELNARKLMRMIFQAQWAFLRGEGKGNFATKWSQLCPSEVKPEGKPADKLTFCSGYYRAETVGGKERMIELETASVRGYYFGPLQTQTVDGKITKFSLVGFPCYESEMSRCGSDCFFIDETGVLRHSGKPNVMPDAKSEPLQ